MEPWGGSSRDPIDNKCVTGDVITHPKLDGKYLVIEAKYSGGGYGHGPHDIFPDRWSLTLRKIDPETGEIANKGMTMFQSGCFTFGCILGDPPPEVVGKMRKVVTWVDA